MVKKKSDREQKPLRNTEFGGFFRTRRQALGLSLREFCRLNGLDAGNLSRMERGLLSPPHDSKTLSAYAKALKLPDGSPEFVQFHKLAVVETGRLPEAARRDRSTEIKVDDAVRASLGMSARPRVWTGETHLESWAATNDARYRLPQLIRRLIHATVDDPQCVDFPAGEGVQRPGWDGTVVAELGNSFVPTGVSGWELSTENQPGKKAEGEFQKRTKEARDSGIGIDEMTFVFATPRKWQGKGEWCRLKKSLKLWKDVVVLDSSDLEQWLETAPPVDAWLARHLGLRPEGVSDLEDHWANLNATTMPPLANTVFLATRDEALESLRDFLGLPRADVPSQLRDSVARPTMLAFRAASPNDVLDFVAAYVLSLDPETQVRIESRLVIVETAEAWRDLCAARHPLILMAHPKLAVDPEMIAEAVRHGHQTLLCSPRFAGDRTPICVLPPVRNQELEKELIASGVPDEKARRLAADSGGSLAVVKRSLARFPHTSLPEWAQSAAARDLLPMLLAGGWDDRNPSDQAVMTRLAGRPYHEVLSTANHWLQQSDPPVMRVQSTWSLVSREDSWLLLAPLLTRPQLDLFTPIAIEVLSADNPGLELAADDRWQAALHGKQPIYSSDLRTGLAETVVLLAVKSSSGVIADALDPTGRAKFVVRELLSKDATWKRWSSLSRLLPLLAESAPDEFLAAVERDLQQPAPGTLKLFEESGRGSTMFNACHHAGLLWALETVAWSPDHFSHAVLALARLAERDPGHGNWGNSPFGSLSEIFLPWHPQTSVDVEQRIRTLGNVMKRIPQIGWKLLLALLPSKQTMSSPIHRPAWRDWADHTVQRTTTEEYWEQVNRCADITVASVGCDGLRVEQVIENLSHFPKQHLEQLLVHLESIDTSAFNDDVKDRIESALRTLITRNRKHASAKWALPSDVVDRLELVRKRFEPTSLVKQHSWLFAPRVELPSESVEDFLKNNDARVNELRSQVLQELFTSGGMSGVLELAEIAKSPRSVGFGLARTGLLASDAEVLPKYLGSEDDRLAELARGFFRGRFRSNDWEWFEQLPLRDWSVVEAGRLLVELGLERHVWDALEKLSVEFQDYYWQRVRGSCQDDDAGDVSFAVEKLLTYQRPIQAIDVIGMALHTKCILKPAIVVSVLDAALGSDARKDAESSNGNHTRWQIQELISYLQVTPNTDKQHLASLELACLHLLDGHGGQPLTLLAALQNDPQIFIDIMRLIFRSDREPPDASAQPTEELKRRASALYELLMAWRDAKPAILPGMRPDGTIDGERLFAWVKKARVLCQESGHLGVCDSQIGELLANEPEPSLPELGWPSEPIRDLLEEVNSESLYHGFEIGIFNKRGVTRRSPTGGGEQEHELARKYFGYAGACQDEWPLVAASLRRTAEGYERDAVRQDEETKRRF